MTVADLKALEKGKATLSLLMNEKGGIKDDCIITKNDDNSFFVVFNGACKEKDLDHLRTYKATGDWKEKDVSIIYSENNSLIAV